MCRSASMLSRGIRWVPFILLITIALPGPPSSAAIWYDYSADLEATYNQDVLRSGGTGSADTIQALRGSLEVNGITRRSSSRLALDPEYLKYNRFTRLNHLDVRLNGLWSFAPGPRSTIRIREAYSESTKQYGFENLEGAVGYPVVPWTRRTAWTFDPAYSADLSRRWRLEAEGTGRSLRFDSPKLTDTTQWGLVAGTTALVAGEQRVGGRVRVDAFTFIDGASGTVEPGLLDRVLSAEALWERDSPGVPRWNVAAGLFQATGAGVPTELKPEAHLWMAWGRSANRLSLDYNLGYSTLGGYGGLSRSRSGEVSYLHEWGRALETSVHGSYVSRVPLGEPPSGGTSVSGYLLKLEAAYRWRSGVGMRFANELVRQDRSSARNLDYQEVSLALTYVSRTESGPPRVHHGQGERR